MTIDFAALKAAALSPDDRSPKGSWDAPLLPLLDLVNAHADHFSTSCCSGRITVYQGSMNDEAVNGKGKGTWLLCEHDEVKVPETQDALRAMLGDKTSLSQSFPETTLGKDEAILFRFEAMVLHITSRTLEAGSQILRAAIEAGFRNSGLIVSVSGRITVGIRPAPSGISVPVAYIDDEGSIVPLINEKYARFLLTQANEHMRYNVAKIERLTAAIRKAFACASNKPEWEDEEARRIRKRKEGLERQAKLQ